MSQLLYPTTVNAVSKQLNANYTAADAVITLTNTTSIQNKPGVCLINRVDTNGTLQPTANWTYIEFTATSGATLTGCTAISGDQDQALGKVVEFVSDVTQQQRILDTLVVGHNDDGTHKASLTFTTPTLTSPVLNIGVSGTAVKDEDDMASNSATALATQQSIKAYTDNSLGNGWVALGHTLTYASADSPTFTATVAGQDLTSVISPGMRMRVSQSTGGTKYFIITAVAFSTNTTITLYGGTDYTLNNEAISSPVFSSVKAPVGFPLDPSKWSVRVTRSTNDTQASPVTNTWYHLGSFSITVPIGIWEVSYNVTTDASRNSGTFVDQATTLSTANNSESDADFTNSIFFGGASGAISACATQVKTKTLTIATKTPYYLNCRSVNASTTKIGFLNATSRGILRAVSAYL